MKSMYFRSTLTGANSALYLPCENPQQPDDFVVEITNVPDDVDVKTVQNLLNKTVVWKVNVIDYSKLGEGKLVTGHGGPRPGAGRPKTGRKKYVFYITDDEYEVLSNTLKTLRNEKKVEL